MITLTNNRYRVQLCDDGCGLSQCDWLALNRWTEHSLSGPRGFFIYLRDAASHRVWSATPAPCFARGAHYEARQAGWGCACDGIRSDLSVLVEPAQNSETRTLVLTNDSPAPRTIEVTSFLEVVLHDPRADAGHPAFAKLFVQTGRHGASGALVAMRRPRANNEQWPCMVHALSGAPARTWATDRMGFIGRGRDARRPAALRPGARLACTSGNVLDACMSLRACVTLQPGERRVLRFHLGMAADQIEAIRWALAWCRDTDQGDTCTPGNPPAEAADSAAMADLARDLQFFNGHGGFSRDGDAHVILMPWAGDGPLLPPMPWVNVIGHETFGVLISEKGAACTWSRNSQANRLTPWSNDPVSDPHGELFLVRDEATGALWSPLAGPLPAARLHEARHGLNRSVFKSAANGLRHELTWIVPESRNLRLMRWRLSNTSHRTRHLALIAHEHLALGTQPAAPGSLQIQIANSRQTLLTRHPEGSDFAGGLVYSSCSCEGADWHGGDDGPHAPPAFSHRLQFTLAPLQEIDAVFLLGAEPCEADVWRAIEDFRHAEVAAREISRCQQPAGITSAIQVSTPMSELDILLNGWLANQALRCRILGRTAFYQSSGACGFRDQLQDAANLLLLDPALSRAQIIRHAQRQFQEGDVMHWWHDAPIARGMRTRMTDDLLWLPWAVIRHVNGTGDTALLDEAVPFVEGPPLADEQEENYLPIIPSQEQASIYEHCCRAIDRSLAVGAHDLPLMGTGDWNDGMNRVGRLGRGESVWLGFFLHAILRDFAPTCRSRGESARAARYDAHSAHLRLSLNDAGWDGKWYRRAFYDDGTPLGSSLNDECQIDSLSQSWAVLSGAAPPDRAHQALDAALARLVDDTCGVTKLLTPPFARTPHDPGYIKGYVAGVRENGGQYSHAACWLVQALAEAGRRDEAARLLQRLSPVWHARTPEAAQRYKVEPYVIAADIYGEPPHQGRGGWTWYTGSAAWMLRVALESVLGITLRDGRWLVVRPRVPDSWPCYSLRWRSPQGAVYDIRVFNPDAAAGSIVFAELNGEALSLIEGAAWAPLLPDGEHTLKIVLGTPAP